MGERSDETPLEDPGSLLSLDVESLCFGRSAIARNEGRVVFVERAAPGDRVLARVNRRHPSYDEAELVELIEHGPARVTPLCPIVDECGGCPWQHVSYEAQLEAKRRAVVDALERIGDIEEPQVAPTVPSPLSYGYRNRLKLRFDKGRLGFYRAHSHSLARVGECPVAESRVSEALPEVETFVAGLATQVTRVEVASRGELAGLVLAVNSCGRLRRVDSRKVHDFLDNNHSRVTGLVMWGRGWRREWGDTRRRSRPGPDDMTIEVSGNAFGQVNTEANPLLVGLVIDAVKPGPWRYLLDLYAGSGNLTLALAPLAERAVAVEADRSSVEGGRRSARFRRLDAVRFKHDRVEAFLDGGDVGHPDVVVANPPRAGLAATWKKIAALGARRIVYVSCNPPALARDLKSLATRGYSLHRATPLDLFPHTFHVETVCVLELTCRSTVLYRPSRKPVRTGL